MKKIFVTIVTIALLCAGAPVFAQTQPANGALGYTPLEPIPGVPQTGTVDIGSLIEAYFRIFILLGGFIAVAALVIGGISYMLSDVGHTLEEAKRRIQAALWGLLLLLASWLILNTINPQLVNFNLNFNPTPQSSSNLIDASNSRSSSCTNDIRSCQAAGSYIRINPDNSCSCLGS